MKNNIVLCTVFKSKTNYYHYTMKKLLLSLFIFMMSFAVWAQDQTSPVTTNVAATSVSYLVGSWDETNKVVKMTPCSVTNYTTVTSSSELKWNSGTYVVNSDVTIDSRVEVTGTVNLILCDGKTLTIEGGIYLCENNVLNIYGQTEGTGALICKSFNQNDIYDINAAIGGNGWEGPTEEVSDTYGENAGTLTISGGNVTANGYFGAGVGGGAAYGFEYGQMFGGYGGPVTIYGGTLTATGVLGAGIGGGSAYGGQYFEDQGILDYGGDGGTMTVYGGIVTAQSSNSVAIGTGSSDGLTSANGELNIVNENMVALNGYNADLLTAMDDNNNRFPYMYITTPKSLTLSDNSNNSSSISNAGSNDFYNVTLSGRTLYRDNKWNTICLPFSLGYISGSPLDGADIRALESASFEDGVLTLTFTTYKNRLDYITAGTPYLVKWWDSNSSLDDIVNPVFKGVRIQSDLKPKNFADVVTFTGTYDYMSFDSEDNTKLFLSSGNKLYYPTADAEIGAFRAYFQLADGITAGQPNTSSAIKAFVLNFDDESETTGITTIHSDKPSTSGWFTLDGLKLNEKPQASGIYINNGQKVIIK